MQNAYYSIVYLYTIIVLTLLSFSTIKDNYEGIKNAKNSRLIPFLLFLALAWWIGQRPVLGGFGDSYFYNHTYGLYKTGMKTAPVWGDSEFIWEYFAYQCAYVYRLKVSTYFTIISFVYFGCMYWACKRLMPNNVLVAFLFCLGAFSCYTYSTNGLRNGVACSIVLLALSFAKGNNKDKVIAAFLAYVAYNIHNSTMIPIAVGVMSLFFIKSFKAAYTFWIISILISLVAGGLLTSLFSDMFAEESRVSYLTSGGDKLYTKTYFRWDFLIYSMMPIILGYYVIIKKGIQDKTYTFLISTYTLANAFWVMVIRANYSNRFAYLSWFMYPIVLAYPLLRLDIWGENQGKRLKQIMFAQLAFTWFMSTFM